jgi:hypothetical protein
MDNLPDEKQTKVEKMYSAGLISYIAKEDFTLTLPDRGGQLKQYMQIIH